MVSEPRFVLDSGLPDYRSLGIEFEAILSLVVVVQGGTSMLY
jgi:hypothetical protein